MKNSTILFLCHNFYGITNRNLMMLVRAGIEVSVFAPAEQHPLLPVKGVKLYDAGQGCTSEEYLRRLKEHLDSFAPYDLIVPNDEEAFRILESQMNVDWVASLSPMKSKRFPMNVLHSKAGFIDLCQDLGLPAPSSAIVNDRKELDAAVRSIRYPMIIKPENSCGGQGVSLIRQESELDAAWEKAKAFGSVIAQKYIKGTPGALDGFFHNGKLIGWFNSYKSRVFPAPFGPSCERTVASHSNSKEILTKFGKGTQFHGFMSFDWIEDDKTGEIYLIELNARPTSSFSLGHLVGVPFGKLCKKVLEKGTCLPADPKMPKEKLVIPMFPAALHAAFFKKNPRDIIRTISNKYFWKDLSFDNPSLLKMQTVFMIKVISSEAKKTIARKFRPLGYPSTEVNPVG